MLEVKHLIGFTGQNKATAGATPTVGQDTKSLYFTSRTTLSGSVSNRLLLTNDRHFAFFLLFLFFFFLLFLLSKAKQERLPHSIIFHAGRLFPASRFHLLLPKGFIIVPARLKPLFPSSRPPVPYLDNRSSLSALRLAEISAALACSARVAVTSA